MSAPTTPTGRGPEPVAAAREKAATAREKATAAREKATTARRRAPTSVASSATTSGSVDLHKVRRDIEANDRAAARTERLIWRRLHR